MSQTHEAIGSARKLGPGESFRADSGVGFDFYYGIDKYGLVFENGDMEKILKGGIATMLGNRALGGYDYRLELGGNELPLFIGARSLEIPPDPDGYHDVIMETNIVTESIVEPREQRGILLTRRRGWDGSWEFVRYDVQPPLRNIEDVVVTADERAAA